MRREDADAAVVERIREALQVRPRSIESLAREFFACDRCGKVLEEETEHVAAAMRRLLYDENAVVSALDRKYALKEDSHES